TVYFAISMRVTDGRIAATMFSILMAVANIGTGIGLGVTGIMADKLGFRWSFVVIALLNLLALPLMGIIFPRKVGLTKKPSEIQN
ncbi:MAG: MFS transporter, partial [Chloroflexi bacterium]|nr:MFS transporter [Chloroflexota bacterium]